MLLTDLISSFAAVPHDNADLAAIDIISIAADSRAVTKGDMFFALAGSHADGRDFAAAAITLTLAPGTHTSSESNIALGRDSRMCVKYQDFTQKWSYVYRKSGSQCTTSTSPGTGAVEHCESRALARSQEVSRELELGHGCRV